jgi:hypothetical protein
MMHIRTAAFVLFTTAAAAFAQDPSSVNNGDSCDIAVAPAATLLLPYFEVDTSAAVGAGSTTLFTITNTSRHPQIAHVTLWTDWAFPVLAFDVLLTGYDVHGINLFDVIVRGILTPSASAEASPFQYAFNTNFAGGDLHPRLTCAGLPTTVPPDLLQAVRSALTTGTGYNITGAVNCPGPIGANHGTIAKGYVTVDVVSYCSSRLVADGSYYSGTGAPILFDNVLIGDYQQIGPTAFGFGTATAIDAQGGPMVHIRAVPEGGLSGASGGQAVQTNLPFTFYDRYTPPKLRTADRRQPLPSMWAARFIQGGTGTFATDFKIWREGITTGLPTCSSNGTVKRNSALAITSMIRFDEHENATGLGWGYYSLEFSPSNPSLPATSRTPSPSSVFPQVYTADLGGWMFFNLSSGSQYVNTNGGLAADLALSAQRAGFGPNPPGTPGSRMTTQNWVNAFMFGVIGANRLSVDFAGAWLGNGCTPADSPGAVIAPAIQRAGPLVCPNKVSKCGPSTLPPAVNP